MWLALMESEIFSILELGPPGPKKFGRGRDLSRVLYPKGAAAIYLGPVSPPASSDPPAGLSGRAGPSCLSGLAPGGVYRAAPVTRSAGELLPHLFTLTSLTPLKGGSAVCFLWHFPSPYDAQGLPGALPSGARTFLTLRRGCAPFP